MANELTTSQKELNRLRSDKTNQIRLDDFEEFKNSIKINKKIE